MSMEVKRTGRKHAEWKIAVIVTSGLLLAVGIFLFYFKVYQVAPVFSEATYEYGTRISREITDYISGTEWSVNLGELDLSGVNEGRTGTYEAVVRHGGSQFAYTITIQDTVAPEIRWKEGPVYLAVDTACRVEDVVEGVMDVDTQVQTFFLREGVTLEEISFDRTGEYDLEILARDRAGNESWGRVRVIVDTPPVFAGLHDFYMVPGSEPDYLENVEAWDRRDGDLTECIEVDDDLVNAEKEGVYTLRYLVSDLCGLESVGEAQVTVASPEEIQSMIGRRQIDYRVDTILGAPNVYDAGASEQEDLDAALKDLRPALVQLYHATGRGGYSSGSGYIMEITQDSIYICSNRHVVEKHDQWDVYFFDGARVPGEALGTSEGYDVGVARVALEDVPQELLNKLMTVHIDMSYWEGLDRQGIQIGLERVDRSGGLMHTTRGHLIKIKQDFEWYEHLNHTEVTVKLVQGDSGSAVLDGYGNLICMAYAFSSDPQRYWCVPLDGILSCYKEITGRTPYVY